MTNTTVGAVLGTMHGWSKPLALVVGVLLLEALAGTLIVVFGPKLVLAISVVSAFVVLLLCNAEGGLLLLILSRAGLDATSGVDIVGLGGSVGFNLSALVSMGVIATAGIYLLAKRPRFQVSKIPLFWPQVGFLIFLALGLVRSSDLFAGVYDWFRLCSAFLVYVLAFAILTSTEKIRRMLHVIIGAAVIPLGIGFYQLITDTGNHFTPGFNRIFATFAHPNVYAFFLLLVTPIAAVLMRHSVSSRQKRLLGALLVVLVAEVGFTYTRGAWFGFAVILLAVGLLRDRRVWLVLTMIAAGVFLIPQTRERVVTAFAREPEISSLASRTLLWRAGLREIQENPILGIGAGTFELRHGTVPHNDYLRVLVSGGLLAFGAFVWILVALFRLALRVYRQCTDPFLSDMTVAFIGVICAYSVMGLADNIIANPVLQWYLYAFGAAVASTWKRKLWEGSARMQAPYRTLCAMEPSQ